MSERTGSALPSSKDEGYESMLESIVFKVEDTTFKVPRYQFSRNDLFSSVFTLPALGIEGLSEAKPFELLGVLKEDFRSFLRALYPQKSPPDYNDMTTEDWLSVLKLSDMWNFKGLREFAIDRLSQSRDFASVDKILLGEKYKLSEWFLEGCKELIKRNKGPQLEEIQTLGYEKTFYIYEIRELRLNEKIRGGGFNSMTEIRKRFPLVSTFT